MIKPCPFCNKEMQEEDIRHSGIYFIDPAPGEEDEFRQYIWKDIKPEHHPIWKLECYEYKGGCGAYIIKEEKTELIKTWNKRFKKER